MPMDCAILLAISEQFSTVLEWVDRSVLVHVMHYQDNTLFRG